MNKLCLVAIDVRSSLNVGSFMRTADGFLADMIMVGITPYPKGKPADIRLPHVAENADRAIAKTALGAEKTLRWQYFSTAVEAFAFLRKEKFVIAAVEQNAKSKPIEKMTTKNNSNLALVVGSETEGLSQEIIDACDEVYEIPMIGQKESFNVAVAAGIALYQARILLC